jgi:hypothetical protein
MRARSVGGVIAVALLSCAAAAADDRWESGFGSDDTPNTPNQLVHGAVQAHDIQSAAAPAGDQDFSYVAAKAGHSYEVRVFSSSMCIRVEAVDSCARLARVASNGSTILTDASAPDDNLPSVQTGWLAVRWTANANQHDFIRMNGYVNVGATATAQYEIQMRDTTYLVPRWNSSGTQTTVFLIQNGSPSTVAGSILFYSAAGVLVHTEPLSVAARGLQVFSTAGVPALAGGSGSAAIVHDGGYGSLAGKAVALEPATGFTFDTLIAPIPY